MSANKNASIRYRILDKCLKDMSRWYTLDDLTEAVNEKFDDMLLEPISRRTVSEDIRHLTERMSFNAPIRKYRFEDNKCYYRYSDPNFELYSNAISEDDIERLVQLFEKFRGLPQMEWMEETITRLKTRNGIGGRADKVVSFECNERLQGLGYLSLIVDAAMSRQCLSIDYRSYKGTVLHKIIHPYYVKQYNSRWYLLGLDDEYGNVYPLALDRMTGVRLSHTEFRKNTTTDFNDYFSDIIGVTREEGRSAEEVVLRFSPQRFPYVVSKPLHVSQRTLSDERCEVSIVVRPNKELEQKLFSFGPDVELLSPAWMRREFAEKIAEMRKKYSALQTGCNEGE